MTPHHVVWHDVECGAYRADLPLWQELASEADGRILDVGAGTGRVAIPLASAGHAVTALDLDPDLLAELRARADIVETVVADAAGFALPQRYDLILVPMQTIQLLDDRDGFFRSARAALAPRGRVVLAIATALDPYDGTPPLPDPDLGEHDGWSYVSQPVAVRVDDHHAEIERVRERIGPNGEREAERDVIRLHVVTPGGLAEEAAKHGLEAEALRHIPPTDEHVGSEVLIFRG